MAEPQASDLIQDETGARSYWCLRQISAKLDTVISNQQASSSARQPEGGDDTSSTTFGALSGQACKVVAVFNPSLVEGTVRYGSSGTEYAVPSGGVREFFVTSNANELQWKTGLTGSLTAIFYSLA